MSADGVGVATGEGYADALAGSVALGRDGSVLLLASQNNASSFGLLAEHAAEVNLVRFLGGEKAVTGDMKSSALKALGWNSEALR